jgi:aspartokinase
MSDATRVKVGGIMARAGLAMVNVLSLATDSDLPGTVLYLAGKQNINIEIVVYCLDIHGTGNMAFCIDRRDLPTLGGIQMPIGVRSVIPHPEVAMLSVFGPHFRERPMISGLMFSTLGSAGIRLLAISTSISTCSCVIPEGRLEEGVKALHLTFDAPHQQSPFCP